MNKRFLKSSIRVNNSYEGSSIERKVERLVNNKEPIPGDVPLTYTEKRDGVRAEMDIRTDRWEIAADAMDKGYRSDIAKREAKMKTDADFAAKRDNGGDNKQA